jgi:hypothetical protein
MDPVTNQSTEFGLSNFVEYGGVRDFFARFNISLVNATRVPTTTRYVDFTTGKDVSGYVPANSNASTAAMLKYAELCEKYEPLISPSYANFPPPGQIPEDLTMKFADFVEKYQLQATVSRIYAATANGMGGMDQALTMYVMQAFGATVVRNVLGQTAGLVPASRHNQDLYNRIADLLGDDVLYQSTVERAQRFDDHVELLVRTQGKPDLTLIRAKRLLVAFEPVPKNTAPLNMQPAEEAVFSQFEWSQVFPSIIRHPSLPVNYSLSNLPASAAPSNYLNLPKTPMVVRYDYLGGKNFRAMVIAREQFNASSAQQLIRDTFNTITTAGTIPSSGGQEPEFVAFADHGPMHMRTSAENIRSGFIQKQYALQGKLATFWTGAAWSAQLTTSIWEFNNQYLLPKIVASLNQTHY